MSDNENYLFRDGQLKNGQFELDLTPEKAGWEFSGLKVLNLPAGASQEVTSGNSELLVLPLEGGCTVKVGRETFEIKGRKDIWSEITDYLYVPINTTFTVSSEKGGRFALPSSVAKNEKPLRYCPQDEVISMIRGKGDCTREVHNYTMGNPVEVDHVLVTEVITPGGNWSSYPPHKHDEHSETERILEEIYYYQVKPAANGTTGMALQRIYPSKGHTIDVCAEVHSGDVVVMPHGWHGPSVAAPGYHLYYLNVMAGPAEDATWLVTIDPDYVWLTEDWGGGEADPRLPMTNATIKED